MEWDRDTELGSVILADSQEELRRHTVHSDSTTVQRRISNLESTKKKEE